eukprot:tig00001029_g6444.t2
MSGAFAASWHTAPSQRLGNAWHAIAIDAAKPLQTTSTARPFPWTPHATAAVESSSCDDLCVGGATGAAARSSRHFEFSTTNANALDLEPQQGFDFIGPRGFLVANCKPHQHVHPDERAPSAPRPSLFLPALPESLPRTPAGGAGAGLGLASLSVELERAVARDAGPLEPARSSPRKRPRPDRAGSPGRGTGPGTPPSPSSTPSSAVRARAPRAPHPSPRVPPEPADPSPPPPLTPPPRALAGRGWREREVAGTPAIALAALLLDDNAPDRPASRLRLSFPRPATAVAVAGSAGAGAAVLPAPCATAQASCPSPPRAAAPPAPPRRAPDACRQAAGRLPAGLQPSSWGPRLVARRRTPPGASKGTPADRRSGRPPGATAPRPPLLVAVRPRRHLCILSGPASRQPMYSASRLTLRSNACGHATFSVIFGAFL